MTKTLLDTMKYEDYEALEDRAFGDQNLQDKFIQKNYYDFQEDMSIAGVDSDYTEKYEYSWIEKNTTRFLEFAKKEYGVK